MADETNQGGTPVTPPKKPVADPQIELQGKVATAVRDWRDTFLRNSAFSRNTGAWNTLEKSLPALIERVVQEISK